ncbi:MAG: hypothetical protein CSA05_01820 [Bacteroidia bacterium]|nr:MAG: hypothetical protein CSA05_01820 [Bacteroidia bacterium]
MYKKIFYLCLLIFIITSCNTTEDKADADDKFVVDDNQTETILIDEEVMKDIVKSFSNPIEMAALVKSVGTAFSLDYLCPTERFDQFNTDFQKALGLGLLSTDLGYLNIYEKTSSIVAYIQVIKRMADDLRIGQFFDFQTLKRLATTNENLERLMYESVASFNQMDNHLREHGRSNMSSLIVTGVFIEGLYLGTQVYKESRNEEIGERLGEQKIILNELLIVLKNFKGDKQFQALIEQLEEIKKEYDGVQISYRVGEPQAVEVDGKLKIIQTDESIVDITEEQLDNIIKVAEKVRNKIINQ